MIPCSDAIVVADKERYHLVNIMDNCKEHPSCNDNDSFSSSNSSSNNIDTISTDINKITITDDELFKDPPLQRDCSICFLPMPYAPGACGVNTSYQLCCGKIICECMNIAPLLESELKESLSSNDGCSSLSTTNS